MGNLAFAIRTALDRAEIELEAVDLHQVATLLKPVFPELSLCELAKRVAEVAVMEGFRYLVWDPPAEDGTDLTSER